MGEQTPRGDDGDADTHEGPVDHGVQPAPEPPDGTTAPTETPAASVPPGAADTTDTKSGVTFPVAVPVTVALVLGLAIGLILGWVIPRPGDDDVTADTVTGSDTATPGPEADDADTQAGSGEGTALVPAFPSPVPGGPDGTEEVAGLPIGDTGPTVEVFEDYVCPFCARLELASGAELREAALAGEYRLVLHPIAFLTEDSPRAANASACVYQHEEPDTWVAFHEALYQAQDPSETVGQFSTEILLTIAEEVGATSEPTSSCIQDGTYTAWVAAITQQSFERGVRGTPTLTVDGVRTDAAPLVQ